MMQQGDTMQTIVRWARFSGAMTLILMLAACQSMPQWTGLQKKEAPQTQPPNYLVLEILGQADPAEFLPPEPLSTLFEGDLAAWAVLPPDETIKNPVESELMTRLAVRRQALRGLGQQILNTKPAQGASVGERFGAQQAVMDQLTELIEARAQVTYQDLPEGMRADAVLPAAPVRELLLQRAKAEAAAQPLVLNEGQKIQAQRLAVQNGRQLMREQLTQKLAGLATKDGRTVEQLCEQSASFKRDMDAMIFLAEPDEIVYKDDTSCQMTLFFDQNRILQLAERHEGRWLGIF